MQSNNSLHQGRQISSSHDRCKCPQCKDQAALQLHSSKPISSIYLHRHLKKRQGPPDKKEANKDTTHKLKMPPKPEGEFKLAATPGKHKADRSKDANIAVLTPEYHMVSHSQRLKLAKESQQEIRREERMKARVKPCNEGLKLAQVSQNFQNLKVQSRQAPSAQRARIEANPNGGNLVKVEAPRPISLK